MTSNSIGSETQIKEEPGQDEEVNQHPIKQEGIDQNKYYVKQDITFSLDNVQFQENFSHTPCLKRKYKKKKITPTTPSTQKITNAIPHTDSFIVESPNPPSPTKNIETKKTPNFKEFVIQNTIQSPKIIFHNSVCVPPPQTAFETKFKILADPQSFPSKKIRKSTPEKINKQPEKTIRFHIVPPIPLPTESQNATKYRKMVNLNKVTLYTDSNFVQTDRKG